MRKSLFNTPSDSNLSDTADFAELQCLISAARSLSKQDLERALNKAADPDSAEGIEDEATGSVSHFTEQVFLELGRREDDCGPAGYPFELHDDVLILQSGCWDQPLHCQYLFMLIATRNNMKNRRLAQVAGNAVDGADLFEHLSSKVARTYLGSAEGDVRSGSMVIGTSRRASPTDTSAYADAITELCTALGEGGGYKARPDTGKPQDDGLDVVAWRSFTDARAGKLILFGQCKTGNTWDESHITRLDPRSLIGMRTVDAKVAVEPFRSFFCTKRIPVNWTKLISHGCLIFDRCRIVDYADGVPESLVADCRDWARAVIAREVP
jgi:hypothetical protein